VKGTGKFNHLEALFGGTFRWLTVETGIRVNESFGSAGQVLTSTSSSDDFVNSGAKWDFLKAASLDSGLRKQLGSMVTGTFSSNYIGWNSGTNYRVRENNIDISKVLKNTLATQTLGDFNSAYHQPSYVVGGGYLRSVSVSIVLQRVSGDTAFFVTAEILNSSRQIFTSFNIALTRITNTDNYAGSSWRTVSPSALVPVSAGSPLYIKLMMSGDSPDRNARVLALRTDMTFTAMPHDKEI
jgi:hypothetical protein